MEPHNFESVLSNVTAIQSQSSSVKRFSIVSNGPGTQLVSWLSSTDQSNGAILESTILYGVEGVEDFCGRKINIMQDQEIARLMAGRAFARSLALKRTNDQNENLFGVSLYSKNWSCPIDNKSHSSSMEIFIEIGIWKRDLVKCFSIRLSSSLPRDRFSEEIVMSKILLNTIAEQCEIESSFKSNSEEKAKILEIKRELSEIEFLPAASDLYDRKISFFRISSNGFLQTSNHPSNTTARRLILSGSFNPFHYGHWELLAETRAIYGNTYYFYDYELSAFNVDKPPIEVQTILDRLSQFSGIGSLLVTNAPTFLEKSRLFPKTTFLVGYDTAIRILNKKYYQDSEEGLMAALKEIKDNECDFIVGGRLVNGKFMSPSELQVAEEYKSLFKYMEQFRVDISSTEIREQRKGRFRRTFET